MRPENLLALVRELARREAGRPRSVSLRRAVSTAYHALRAPCATSLVGTRGGAHYSVVYRSLYHRRSLDRLRASGPSLSAIARSFETLQDERHEADYSPEPFSPKRDDALDLIEMSSQAIAVLDPLTPDEMLALAIGLVVKPR